MVLQWPDGWYPYNRPHYVAEAWHGTLLEDKRDAAGTLYRRNRYYDPATGRFTQEDPIGLAGGVNLYGFGGGDPVNRVDPFGLHDECNERPGTEAPQCVGKEVITEEAPDPNRADGFNAYPSDRGGRPWAGGTPVGTAGAAPTTTIPELPPGPSAAACAAAATAAGFATVQDLMVFTGMGLAAKGAYYGAMSIRAGAMEIFKRYALEEVGATYLLSGRVTMRNLGATSGGGILQVGTFVNSSLASGSFDWRGLAIQFVPGWNAWRAISQAVRACFP